jgi:hypothetical protein
MLPPTKAGAATRANNVAKGPNYPTDYAHMRVVSKPPDQTRQSTRNVGPVIKGDGNMTYLCGDCETSPLETVEYKLVRDVVVKCEKCAATMISRPPP